MDGFEDVERIVKEAREVRLNHDDLSKRAGINAATWWRIRNRKTGLSVKVLGQLEAAIRDRRAEIATPAPRPPRKRNAVQADGQ